MKKDLFVLSDIHLGSGLDSDWFQHKKHLKSLLAMLEHVRQHGSHTTLVLAGDIFDTWLCRMNTRPPTISAILRHNQIVIDKLKELLCDIEQVIYINGNHDMHVTPDDLKVISHGKKTLRFETAYCSDLIRIEHGHHYALFNAEDRLNDPLHGLPVGYFITRMLAGHHKYTSPKALFSYIDDLIEAAFTSQTFASSVVEAVAEYAGLDESERFLMPFGRETLSIADVKQQYKDLLEHWVKRHGKLYAINSVRAEMGKLGWFADSLAKDENARIVVMGHTHESKQDEDSWFLKENRVYLNSGSWSRKDPSFVHIKEYAGHYSAHIGEIQPLGLTSLEPGIVINK